MPKPTERVEVQSVNGGAQNRIGIARDKSEAMKQAILHVVPKDEHGFPRRLSESASLDLERLDASAFLPGSRPQQLRWLN